MGRSVGAPLYRPATLRAALDESTGSCDPHLGQDDNVVLVFPVRERGKRNSAADASSRPSPGNHWLLTSSARPPIRAITAHNERILVA